MSIIQFQIGSLLLFMGQLVCFPIYRGPNNRGLWIYVDLLYDERNAALRCCVLFIFTNKSKYFFNFSILKSVAKNGRLDKFWILATDCISVAVAVA